MILYTRISTEDTEDLIVFNDYFWNRQEELKERLTSLKPSYLVEEILAEGIFLTEEIVFEFIAEGEILKQYKDGTDSYQRCRKGKKVVIGLDGSVKKCKISKILHRLTLLKEDYRTAYSELGDEVEKIFFS